MPEITCSSCGHREQLETEELATHTCNHCGQPRRGPGSKEIAPPPPVRGKAVPQAVQRAAHVVRFVEQHQSNNFMGAINFRLIAGCGSS